MKTVSNDGRTFAADRNPARSGPALLRKDELHPALGDPQLDSMGFLNEVTLRYPTAISFAPGRPYDGFFDVNVIFEYIQRFLDHLVDQGRSPAEVRDFLFQYGPAAGRIRELVARSLEVDENIRVPAESIVITVGGQEAMVLTLRALFASPDDVLIVCSPCYVGITGAAYLLGIDVVAVPERDDGLNCADLEAALVAERRRGRRVRAVYVVPDHSNPSGRTIPLPVREDLLELAAREDFLVLEDSPYRVVSPGERVPLLKALDTWRRVVHIGSYSKTVFPGARVGFVVADQEILEADGGRGLLADELAKVKSMITVNTSSLSQAVVAGALLACDGRLSQLNEPNAAYYGDAMHFTLAELGRRFPRERSGDHGVTWHAPEGGFFLALEVPFVADNDALRRSAVQYGVIWTPMSYFYPGGGGEKGIRMSISYLSHAEIVEGVSRLAAFIENESRSE